MKTAIVHDYLMVRGGAERVVEAMHELYPQAPVYTSVYNAEGTWPSFKEMDVRASFLQKFPGATRSAAYKLMLPFFPHAFESFDLSGYDLVLSSTSSFAKGVITGPEALHICYCHTPARFAWRFHDYMQRERINPVKELVLGALISRLREWDLAAAGRVDHFIANSRTTAERIEKFYRRPATIIEPPIDAERYQPAPAAEVEDYFLIVSRLAPYKRIDLAIEACNRLGLKLKIVGDGPDRERLHALAGPTVEFAGYLDDDAVARTYARARAFILPGEEDFGMTPLEANAAGRPVIAFAGGGARETVVDGQTGLHFHAPTVDALAGALGRFAPGDFRPAGLRAHALRFSRERFLRRMHDFVRGAMNDRRPMPLAASAELPELLGQLLRLPGAVIENI